MTQKLVPELLYEHGFTDLISVIPPGAQLSPSSKIQPNQIGKVPGRKNASGLYGGYDWRRTETTIDDVRKWALDGANIGLRADRFPGVDIDTTDPALADAIEQVAVAKLGAAPVRVGRAPKRLLMYRTDAPFARMRLWITRGEQHHLVEVLGQGQQYVVHGTHPATLRPYTWDVPIGDVEARQHLHPVTRELATEFLDEVQQIAELMGYGTAREGDGRPITRSGRAQGSLLAPSIELLREAVEKIPNTSELFPDRTSYLKMGYAIRAAAGDDVEEGRAIFSEWASRWPGDARSPHGNDPDVVVADYGRFTPPYSVGWGLISELAREHGFDSTALDFDVLDEREHRPDDQPVRAPLYSEQWLADKVVEAERGVLRFSPERGVSYVWNRGKWEPDAELLAEDIIKRRLRVLARDIEGRGGTDKEKREMAELAVRVCSAGKAAAVWSLVRSDRSIAVSQHALDHDPWLLNTPNGIVDLKTGKLRSADPDALCTKATSCAADFGATPARWLAFLDETTGGDVEMQRYLQRLAGYALTGVTYEQNVTFVWGPGGNGKSVFANVLLGILGDYGRTAPMDTFTASNSERHSTDVAGLVGARLVVASETQAGKRWDDQRVKSLSGGEPVSARFMRQDFFTFLPTFKLLFLGNHKPEMRNVDDAMRRRIHLVPFTRKPAVVDRELSAKLREEYPAILAWMIEGCLMWQRDGLAPPASVREATEEYFAEEDAIGQWLRERIEIADGTVYTQALFDDWREWANENNEFVGTTKRLVSALSARGLAKWRDPVTRRMGFAGIQLKNTEVLGRL